MKIGLTLSLFLLGHILGDFYFQGDKPAAEKDVKTGKLILHGFLYALCVGVALFGAFEYTSKLPLVVYTAAVLHFIVDCIKACIIRRRKKKAKEKPRFMFSVDQLIHIAVLVALRFSFRDFLTVRAEVVSFSLDFLRVHPVIAFLGLLCVLRPAGCLIGSGDLWDLSKKQPASDAAQKGAGRMIGYLERFIVFILLLNGEFSPIGFVIAAKAVMRFPEIGKAENGHGLAEYYLIGTLLSLMSVFAVALLLGLIKAKP